MNAQNLNSLEHTLSHMCCKLHSQTQATHTSTLGCHQNPLSSFWWHPYLMCTSKAHTYLSTNFRRAVSWLDLLLHCSTQRWSGWCTRTTRICTTLGCAIGTSSLLPAQRWEIWLCKFSFWNRFFINMRKCKILINQCKKIEVNMNERLIATTSDFKRRQKLTLHINAIIILGRYHMNWFL